jgi:hypothetical protein
MFVAQALSAEGSCQHIVNQVALKRALGGLPRCATDTGAYCRARSRLPEQMIADLVRETGALVSPARFVARDGRIASVGPESLQGLKIGVRRGTTFDNYLTDNFSGVSDIHRYSTQPDALLDLVLGRIDLILGDHITLEQNFLESPQGEGFGFIDAPVTDSRWFGYGNGVALPKGDPGMRQILDRAVADMQAKGVLRRISERWFGYQVRDLSAELRPGAKAAVP